MVCCPDVSTDSDLSREALKEQSGEEVGEGYAKKVGRAVRSALGVKLLSS